MCGVDAEGRQLARREAPIIRRCRSEHSFDLDSGDATRKLCPVFGGGNTQPLSRRSQRHTKTPPGHTTTTTMIHHDQPRQVDFSKRGGDDDKSEVVDPGSLLPPSSLLGFDSQAGGGGEAPAPGAALDSSLCYRTIRARHDVLRADSSPAQAADARDAMAKAIYGG